MGFIIFIFGLIIGSFLNVCIYRIPQGLSISYPPSSCTHCNSRLKKKDLIPVISWLFLGGKCRYCGESINSRYPFVEMVTAILFLLTYIKIGFVVVLILYLILTSILITISFIDIDHRIIPNKINLFALILFIVSNLLIGYINWKSAILGSFIGGGFLFLLVLLTRGAGMGMGDVKLMGVLGLFLGFKNTILALLLSFILGGFFGVWLLLHRKKGKRDEIPFGPWLAVGTFLSLLYGREIIDWYIGFL